MTGAAATGGTGDDRTRQKVRSRPRRVRISLLFLAAVSAFAFVAGAADANPDLDAKRAQAQTVYNRYLDLVSAAEHAQEALNLANIQLAEIENDLSSNGRHLEVAKASLRVAQTQASDRLRALYIAGEPQGAVEVVLGATDLDDLVSRVDMVQRVGSQDAHVLEAVTRFRSEVAARRIRLRDAAARQEAVVADRAAREREFAARRDEAQRLYESAKAEIAELEAEEARRAARAAEEARRLAAAAEAARLTSSSQSGSELPSLPSSTDFEDGSISFSPPPAKYGGVVGIAMQYLGVPYVWGGMSPSGFDCSGLISYVYAQVGVSLPHHAASQFNYGAPVSRDQLQPGDLVFFDGLGHAGIYVGGGNFIHAPHTGDVVKISSIYQDWYASRWVGGRRIL